MQVIIPKFFLAFILNTIFVFIKMENSRILTLSFTDLQDAAHVISNFKPALSYVCMMS